MKTEKRIVKEICEGFLDRAIDLYDIPGIALGVMAGETVFTGARGFRNYIAKDPMKADHVFHCGSVSKLFTAMGIMRLVEEGKVRLSDRLVDLLPYLSITDERCEKVRLFHMLSHTSGLGDVEDYHWDKPRKDEGALKDYALSEEVSRLPMLWEPGEGGFRYSNMAYELLGLIIAEKSGCSYESFMAETFLKPCGMENSTFLTFKRTGGSLSLEEIDKTDMAMPYKKAEDRSIVSEPHYPYNRQHGPSSTLTSNAADLLKWAQANMKKKALSEKSYREMWRKYAVVPNNGEKMGLAWFMREQGGYEFFGHEGTDNGFRASFWFAPEAKLAIVVLSNITKAPVKKLNKQLAEELLKMEKMYKIAVIS